MGKPRGKLTPAGRKLLVERIAKQGYPVALAAEMQRRDHGRLARPGHAGGDLKRWVERAQGGDEVIITDRGRPVARMTGIDLPGALQELIDEGTVSSPRRERPRARGAPRVRATGPVSSEVLRERETRRR